MRRERDVGVRVSYSYTAERKNDAFTFSVPAKGIIIKYGDWCLVGLCDEYGEQM